MIRVNRSEKNKKMGLPTKVFLWFIGILVLLALIAVIYLGYKIFSVGESIHNPLDRDKSSLRDKSVNLDDGDPFTIALLAQILMPKKARRCYVFHKLVVSLIQKRNNWNVSMPKYTSRYCYKGQLKN